VNFLSFFINPPRLAAAQWMPITFPRFGRR